MEVDGASSSKSAAEAAVDESVTPMGRREKDEVRVKRKSLQAVLQECQRALEMLSGGGESENDDEDVDSDAGKGIGEDSSCRSSSSPCRDSDADEAQLYDMIKSQVGEPGFLQKIENAQASVYLNKPEDGSSWDMVSENDLWEGENADSEQDEYVLVKQEDIVDGIACFMAAYLLSLKQTKDLTPNQLQDALRKTFSVKKRKGKLAKAFDGTRVIYNVASWSATAIGFDRLLEFLPGHIEVLLARPTGPTKKACGPTMAVHRYHHLVGTLKKALEK